MKRKYSYHEIDIDRVIFLKEVYGISFSYQAKQIGISNTYLSTLVREYKIEKTKIQETN